MLRFDDKSKLKEEEGLGIAGSLVDVTLVKSRTSRAGKVATLVFNQDYGYDEELSLYILLKNANRIKGAGAYLYIGDRDDMKFSQKVFKQKLAENEEFRQVFMQEVISVLKESMETDIKQDEEEHAAYANISSNILSELNNSLIA